MSSGTEQRRRCIPVGFRVDPNESTLIREAAKHRGILIADYCRRATLNQAQDDQWDQDKEKNDDTS